MSRSGTSLTAQILSIGGVYLGPTEDLLGGMSSNPDGHWESRPMLRFNEWLLRSQGGNWKAPPRMPPRWERAERLATERCAARRFLAETFAGYDLWGWKDPRNCLTLPFWQYMVPAMRYVICLRNPLDVAASLYRREGMEADQALELWLTYLTAALANTEGCPRIVVAYEDYFDDWSATAGRLLRFAAGGDPTADTLDASERIERAVKAELRHHATPAGAILEDGSLPPEVVSLYLRLRSSIPAERSAASGDGVGSA